MPLVHQVATPSPELLSITPIQRKPAGRQLLPLGSSGPHLHSVWGTAPQSTMCFSLMVSPLLLGPPRNALLRLKLGLWFGLTWFIASVERINIHVWKKKKIYHLVCCSGTKPRSTTWKAAMLILPKESGMFGWSSVLGLCPHSIICPVSESLWNRNSSRRDAQDHAYRAFKQSLTERPGSFLVPSTRFLSGGQETIRKCFTC